MGRRGQVFVRALAVGAAREARAARLIRWRGAFRK